MIGDWRGRRVLDRDENLLGTLEEVYLDDDGEPTRWAVLDTGTGSRSFVPLTGAERSGEDLRIAHSREQVLAAAEVEPDGELTAQEEQRLVRVYGLDGGDVEMVRSEEELRVSTEVKTTGRVRLRKVIVTEDVTVTLTLRREEVRLEPVPDDRTGDETGDEVPSELDDTGETLFEVTLHEEVPVVGTRVVPRERIRLRKILVSEDRQVTAPVRAEQLELTDDRPNAAPAPITSSESDRP